MRIEGQRLLPYDMLGNDRFHQVCQKVRGCIIEEWHKFAMIFERSLLPVQDEIIELIIGGRKILRREFRESQIGSIVFCEAAVDFTGNGQQSAIGHHCIKEPGFHLLYSFKQGRAARKIRQTSFFSQCAKIYIGCADPENVIFQFAGKHLPVQFVIIRIIVQAASPDFNFRMFVVESIFAFVLCPDIQHGEGSGALPGLPDTFAGKHVIPDIYQQIVINQKAVDPVVVCDGHIHDVFHTSVRHASADFFPVIPDQAVILHDKTMGGPGQDSGF